MSSESLAKKKKSHHVTKLLEHEGQFVNLSSAKHRESQLCRSRNPDIG